MRKGRGRRAGARSESPLGCQVWLERTDSRARVDRLFREAAAAGLGWVRLFLIWPWIEREPGTWDFRVFDDAFDAAVKYGIRIKATLTANSGPWHLGTPGMLHTTTGFLGEDQQEPMRRYIAACVGRYASHPGLGQWILWNEPHGGSDRTDQTLALWREHLRGVYGGDLGALNGRWYTGYRSFDEIPWHDEIQHPAHRKHFWNPYRPELDYQDFKAWWVNEQLRWVGAEVRRLDPRTPLCANPIFIVEGQGTGGTDLVGMSKVVTVLGASTHPPFWGDHVSRWDFPAVIHTAVRTLGEVTGGRHELTEVQSGNTVFAGSRPSGLTPGEIVRFYLAGLAAGATSVTGWCLNTRVEDLEAGEWSLLDDNDGPSERSRALGRLGEVLARVGEKSGAWGLSTSDVLVLADRRSQALEAKLDFAPWAKFPGRNAGDSARGQQLLCRLLQRHGLSATLTGYGQIPTRPARAGQVLLASHVLVAEESGLERAMRFVRAGGTLVCDALSFRYTGDARLARPAPGVIAGALGLEVREHESRREGHPLWVDGRAAGVASVCRAVTRREGGWRAVSGVRYGDDLSPAVFVRPVGKGRVVYASFALGPSLLASAESECAVRQVLLEGASGIEPVLSPVEGPDAVVAWEVSCERGRCVVVTAPEARSRESRPLRLRAGVAGRGETRRQRWTDFWGGAVHAPDENGELILPGPDGIAVLWTP